MAALLWTIAVALLYVTVGTWIVLLADGLRRRARSALWLAAPPVLAWFAWRLAQALPRPWALLVACLPAFAWKRPR